MTEKQLIAKLNSMKDVNLDSTWLKGHREVLYTQVENSGAVELSAWNKLVCEVKALALTASRPAVSVASILLVVASMGIFSHKLFSNAKPNDSLYIARIISEKAKVNMTFNDNNRSKLEAKFAASHAQDIAAVLADDSIDNDSETAKNLSAEFDKEINTVKSSLAKVTPSINASAVAVARVDNNSKENVDDLISPDDQVFAADSSKDSSGIAIYNGEKDVTAATNTDDIEVKGNTSTETEVDLDNGTSTESGLEASSSATTTVDVTDEIKQYFNNKDYNGAIDKLKEIEQSIK